MVHDDRVMLIDFGIAKRLDAHSGAASNPELFYGTYLYAAPEQFDDEFGAISERTDIYALGLVGYQLLTNQFPYPGQTFAKISYAHCHKPLPPLPENIPADIAAFITTCTQRRPEERYQNMAEVEAALDDIMQQDAMQQYAEFFEGFVNLPTLTAKHRAALDTYRQQLGLSQEVTTQIEQELQETREPETATDYGRMMDLTVIEDEADKQQRPQQNVEHEVGDTWTEPTTGMEFVWIPPGTFWMGATEADQKFRKDKLGRELPRHEVTITHGFWMGRYPVTQAQWESVLKNNPLRFKGADRPVESVSWDDCQEFLSRLRSITTYLPRSITERSSSGVEMEFRLPSEAEWEYACRAGTKTIWYFGNDPKQLKHYAWYTENSGDKTHPVGQLQPNAWGLYDMLGNVWEWCADIWHRTYNGAPSDGSVWGSLGDKKAKALHGGSWDDYPTFVRSANRDSYSPDNRNVNIGARLVRAR